MPDKFLIEFFAHWIRDESLRRKVLFRERTAMMGWGLSMQQVDDLVALEKETILDRLRDELQQDLAIDLDKVLEDITNTGGMGTGGGAAGAAYQEGKVHVRGVEPAKITKNQESIVIVRGHGYDDSAEARFVPVAGGAPVQGKVLSIDSDVDVWQRLTVKVTLPSAGKWRVVARIPGNPTQDRDSTEDVQIEVV